MATHSRSCTRYRPSTIDAHSRQARTGRRSFTSLRRVTISGQTGRTLSGFVRRRVHKRQRPNVNHLGINDLLSEAALYIENTNRAASAYGHCMAFRHAGTEADVTCFYEERVVTEQVSHFVGEGFLVNSCGGGVDLFDLIRDWLPRPVGPIRMRRGKYLLYALVDIPSMRRSRCSSSTASASNPY